MMTFTLSTAGLSNIDFDIYEKDFTFYIGEEQFECNKLLADFISPNICKLRINDPTIDCYYINNIGNINANLFNLILSLAMGYTIEIAKEDRRSITTLFSELGNTEFLTFLCSSLDDIDEDNVIDTIKLKSDLGLSINKEISYIASHFHKIERDQLKTLTADQLYMIFAKKGLCVESEDWLFDFIYEMTKKSKSYFSLYEHIEFPNLSLDKIMLFTDTTRLDQLNERTWRSLCRRLQNVPSFKKRKYKGKDKKENCLNIPYSFLNDMKGIFSYMSGKYHCNVGQLNIVKITTSSVYGPHKIYSPNNVVDLVTSSSFQSINIPDQWICFDFKERRIMPSYYSIKSCDGGPGNCHPMNWVIEASNDWEEWIELDRQIDNNVFVNEGSSTNIIASFIIRKPIVSRYFRLRQIGKNSGLNDYLYLAGLEIYGKLIENYQEVKED
ncbi:hypothetical protein TRFO_28734 [Tritrichomonas foetus]|uniref:F5/8 type C domain-containing protein n=1 Tax=Tritrichomonas foetus TaxID=1144522 RepID=A0A1J4K2D0_9EUKA|nr:hypothetical protein TRFO_28734 [Tritrichomonas foetus]|eukprot:OHT03894.1 hypothetical protein TRFO_28734 [Tritrichomonas foetus]